MEADSDAQPITTTVVHRAVGHTMRLPLGASISLDMHGDHYIHAQVLHQFSTRPPAPDINVSRRTVDCPAGHGLLRFSTPRSGFTCDRCRCAQKANSTMFGCRACDYDACAQCFEYGQQQVCASSTPGTRTKYALLILPLVVSALSCCPQDARNLGTRGSAPATAPPSSLIARARQFSSFVLLLGTLNAADEFNPINAIILQNKDVSSRDHLVLWNEGLAKTKVSMCASILPFAGGENSTHFDDDPHSKRICQASIVSLRRATGICQSIPHDAACWHFVCCGCGPNKAQLGATAEPPHGRVDKRSEGSLRAAANTVVVLRSPAHLLTKVFYVLAARCVRI